MHSFSTNNFVSRRTARFGAAILSLALLAQASAVTWTVVAEGLNNPRGLDFAPNGALYIAEAGVGGDGPSIPGAEGQMHFGLSGSVTKVFKGEQTRIVTGLPSLGGDGGFAGTGPVEDARLHHAAEADVVAADRE